MKRKMLSRKHILRAAWLLFTILSLIIWIPSIDRLITNDYAQIKNYVSLDDSWNVAINGESFENVMLDDFYFPAVSKGDSIVMERMLPEEWDVTQGSLRVSIRHSATRVYIDDELIYEYGFDRLAVNKTIGSGFQFINFPSEYRGHTLKIYFYIAEDKVFTKLDSVRVYEWASAYRVIMTENRLPLFFGSFLFIFGVAVAIMTMFALTFSRKYLRLLCVADFSICIGLWTLCYYRVIMIYSIPLYFMSLIEHIALYLAPLPLIIYMHEDVKNLNRKVFRVFYRVLLTFYIVALSVAMTLHWHDIVHLAAILPYMIILMVICLLFFFVVILVSFKENRAANRLYLAGTLILVCCLAYDLIGYGSERYYAKASLLNARGVSLIGVMAFIFSLSFSFYLELTQKLMQETERNSLIKSAYTDELTQLSNRRCCMEYMNRLREKKNSDYTILCFDLNNLKIINDTWGHAKGDLLIKSAADVLAETFAEHGV
ncbi:MAG: diguanylate cyclase, partial [Lachnospiraceae bacterium]|nr:diguanylate cyclase [Lachnospiraceae bacterium]